MENIRNMSIREKAYYLLREAVIDGSLKPGERLVEDSLAAQYNVSRTPLREAIHKLEMEGFLQRLPSRGLVVAELSGKEVEELYQVRGYLEGLAAHEFTSNLTPDNRNMVSTLRQNVVYYHDNGEQEKVLESCKQLHRFVRENCGHKICREYIEKMDLHIARYRRLGVRQAGRVEQAYQEHLQIMDAMLAGDHQAAEETMRGHVLNSAKVAFEAIKAYIQQAE